MYLFTGAGGWLGSRLLEALAKGLPDLSVPFDSNRKLRALVLPGQAAALGKISTRVEFVQGDIRNPADCTRFCDGAKGAILFHTAGIIHPRRVREFYDINRDGTMNLLDAAIRTGVKRAVIMSSNSPCGCNPHPDHLFDERQ